MSSISKCLKCGKSSLLPECVSCLVEDTPMESSYAPIKKKKEIKSTINIKSIMEIHKLKVLQNSKKASFKDLGADKPKDKRFTWHTLGPDIKINKSFLKKSNWGIICNKMNGVIGVDLDCYKWSKEEGCHKSHEFYKQFGNDFVKQFNTYTQRTPSGGIHLIFQYDKDLNQVESKTSSKFGKGIDIRNGHEDKILSGGYLVGAGSVFKKPDGSYATYELLNDNQPQPMPEKLKKWLLENIYTSQEKIKTDKKTKKNNKLYRTEQEILGSIYNFSITDEELDKEILPNMPPGYLNHYSYWFKFTSAMKTLNKKDLWKKWSAKYKGYDEIKNEEKWQHISNNNTEWAENYYVEHLFKICNKYNYLDFVKYKPTLQDTKKPDKIINRTKLSPMENEIDQKDAPLKLNLKQGEQFFVLKSDTGTGKTTLMKKELFDSKQKFISIVSRVSLGKEQYSTFSKYGIDCKFYANSYCQRGDSYITTIDSILGCGNIMSNINEYTIFIDEFNSVLEYILQADTCLNKTRALCWKYLIHMLCNCKNFICVDADISDICFRLLDFVNRDYVYIQNDYKHNKGVKALELLSLDKFISHILCEPKYMVCCDSKKAAEYIWLETGKRAKLLTSKTDKLDDETLDDYDMIIFSPAIIYGLDSSLNRPVFCYHKEHTISPTNMLQQIARNRNITILYFCFNKKKFNQATYLNMKECTELMKEKQEYSNTQFDVLNEDEAKRQDLFNKIFVDYTYKQDCYGTNKYCHFKQLLKTRGFDVNYFNKKTEKPPSEEINEKLIEYKLKTFDIDDQYIKEFNEKYLNLTKAQLLDVKDLFIHDELMNKTFTIKSYFEHGLKNAPLYNAKKEYEIIKNEDFAKQITPEQLAIHYDQKEQYDIMNQTQDIKIKKINQQKYKFFMIDKLKCLMNFKEVQQDDGEEKTYNVITANRVPTETEAKNYIRAYRNVFNYRGKKEPSLKTKYDCEQLLHKILKQTFTKDIFNDNKKVRDGKKFKYLYSMNYDCDILQMTRKLVNYQRRNKLAETLNHMAAVEFLPDDSDEEIDPLDIL